MSLQKFIKCGTTARVDIEARDVYGNLVDVDDNSWTITVTDSAGGDQTPETPPTISHDGLGKYHFSFLIAADGPKGTWHVDCDAEKDSEPIGDDQSFEVKE
jgi:hypothetical protein